MDNEVFIPDGQMEDIIESDVEGGDVGVPEDVADVINVIAKQRAKENRRKLWEEKKEWDLSPEHQMQKLEKFKNFNAALGSIAPLLLGAAELAGTGGKSLDATNKFVADQRAYRSTEDARRIQQLKEQEYARNIADKQKRKDTYSKAAGEMMSGTPGIPQDYEYMKPFLDASMQEDPEDAVKLLLQIMKPKAKEGTIPLTRAEQTWLVDKDLGHLIGGDPDAARSVMVQSGKYTVKPKEVKPDNWKEKADYAEKLRLEREKAERTERENNPERRPVSAGQATAFGDFESSLYQMGEMLTGLADPKTPTGPMAYLRQYNPYDVEAQGGRQLIAATKQMVGKALEGGVLRAEDEIKYAKILPRVGDPLAVIKRKSETLGKMLNNAYKAHLSALSKAGYDVRGFQTGDPAAPAAPATGGSKTVSTKEEWDALPKGPFIWRNPDGTLEKGVK